MSGFASFLAFLFYGATFVAMIYFVHSLLWIARFRRLQARLAQQAEEDLAAAGRQTLADWQIECSNAWTRAKGELSDATPEQYARRLHQDLGDLTDGLASNDVATILSAAMDQDADLTEQFGPGEEEQADFRRVRKRAEVLRMPRLSGSPLRVTLEVSLGRLRRLKQPDQRNFELHLKSRYGTKRRLLVFLFGAADVALSSQHVSRISQHATMPMSVILRRLSLVVLILLVVLVDVAVGARQGLIRAAERWLASQSVLEGWGAFGEFIREQLPVAIGLGIWLGGYGLVYTSLYLYLWLKSKSYLRRLERLRKHDPEERHRIYVRHERQFRDWVLNFGRGLDEATNNTVSQARLLIERTSHRMKQRIAPTQLLEKAEQVAEALFSLLPEASSGLQDEVNAAQRSRRFRFWPLASDMRDQLAIARRRAAWHYLQTTVAELRGRSPDPAVGLELWERLPSVVSSLPELKFPEIPEELATAFPRMLQALVDETEEDLKALDERLAELSEGLAKTFENVQSLIETRYQLTLQAMSAELAGRSAEILQVRERARLEAMAFEI